jgi:16S rRNA (cytosine1402-N4)-methyltransferase
MNQKNNRPHISVMEKELLSFFEGKKITTFFEGTLGAGGHAKALLEAHPEIETYIGCDQDPEALEIAKETLKHWKDKVIFARGNFSELEEHLGKRGIKEVDGFFLTWGCHLCS